MDPWRGHVCVGFLRGPGAVQVAGGGGLKLAHCGRVVAPRGGVSSPEWPQPEPLTWGRRAGNRVRPLKAHVHFAVCPWQRFRS